MIVTRKSRISGKMNTMDLPISNEQIESWQSGSFVQDVFPDLTSDQREFLITGITPDEWNETFDELPSGVKKITFHFKGEEKIDV